MRLYALAEWMSRLRKKISAHYLVKYVNITNEAMIDIFDDFNSLCFMIWLVPGASNSGREEASRGGWALPSNESSQNPGNMMSDAKEKAGSSHSNQSGRKRADVRDKNGYSGGKARD